ncbi:hypothetical protein JCM24511_05528 [Saitozyma sp. JCM 24511]|nr:hypothetical protein JCM24511_05528 [Saitozyma sp. JCM 24511]
MRIPFLTHEHAAIAKRSLEVDREQNSAFVRRTIAVEADELVVSYSTSTVRLLRLATNSFLSSLDLVLRTLSAFAPDPTVRRLTDAELEEIRKEANRGDVRGIELRGDGKGAGSGEEVR